MTADIPQDVKASILKATLANLADTSIENIGNAINSIFGTNNNKSNYIANEILGGTIFANHILKNFPIDYTTASLDQLTSAARTAYTTCALRSRFKYRRLHALHISPGLLPHGGPYDFTVEPDLSGLLACLAEETRRSRAWNLLAAYYANILALTGRIDELTAFADYALDNYDQFPANARLGLILVTHVLRGEEPPEPLVQAAYGPFSHPIEIVESRHIGNARQVIAPSIQHYHQTYLIDGKILPLELECQDPGVTEISGKNILCTRGGYMMAGHKLLGDTVCTDLNIYFNEYISNFLRGAIYTVYCDVWLTYKGRARMQFPPDTVRLDEAVVPLDFVGMRSSYAHWVGGSVPRIIMAREIFGPRTKFSIRGPLTAYQKGYLRVLGVAPEQLVEVPGSDGIELTNPLFVQASLTNRFATAPWEILHASAAFPRFQPVAGPKIYLSRAKSGIAWRGILNEDRLVEVLTRHGFEVLYPDRMSMEEQIAAFQNASHIVVGATGALATAAFCRPGTKILNIEPMCLVGCWFAPLAARLGLELYSLPAVAVPHFLKPESRNSADLAVSQPDLEFALSVIGA